METNLYKKFYTLLDRQMDLMYNKDNLRSKGVIKVELSLDFLKKEMMRAIKEKDIVKKEILPIVIAEIRNKEIDTKTNLSSGDIAKVLQKQIKSMEDTISVAGDRDTTILSGQVAYLKTLLPVQYSEDEIKVILNKLCNGETNKGVIMKTVMPIFSGKADGKLVSKCVDDFIKGNKF